MVSSGVAFDACLRMICFDWVKSYAHLLVTKEGED